jgi:hypothetical protein
MRVRVKNKMSIVTRSQNILFIIVIAIVISISIQVVHGQNYVDIKTKFPIIKSKSYTVPSEFSFKYPTNWKLHERENRFSTIDAMLTYGQFNYPVVRLEGVNRSEFDVPSSDNELIDFIATMMINDLDATVFENGSNKYIINNQSAPYVIGTYERCCLYNLGTGESTDVPYASMYAIVNLNKDQIVLMRYETQRDDFDRYLPNVERILKSITPVTNESKIK